LDYVDDKAMISINSDPVIASLNTHERLVHRMVVQNKVWTNINPSTLHLHSNFLLNHESIYNTGMVPISCTLEYLELSLHNILTWAPHLKTKRLHLNYRLRLPKIFCNNNEYTLINTKLFYHKYLIKAVCTHVAFDFEIMQKIQHQQNSNIPKYCTKIINKCPFPRL